MAYRRTTHLEPIMHVEHQQHSVEKPGNGQERSASGNQARSPDLKASKKSLKKVMISSQHKFAKMKSFITRQDSKGSRQVDADPSARASSGQASLIMAAGSAAYNPSNYHSASSALPTRTPASFNSGKGPRQDKRSNGQPMSVSGESVIEATTSGNGSGEKQKMSELIL